MIIDCKNELYCERTGSNEFKIEVSVIKRSFGFDYPEMYETSNNTIPIYFNTYDDIYQWI